MADGCAREWAEQTESVLPDELVQVSALGLDYIIAGNYDRKSFVDAIANDWGERFRTIGNSLWENASEVYESHYRKNIDTNAPPLVRKPADYLPDYQSLSQHSSLAIMQQVVKNLEFLAKEQQFHTMRERSDIRTGKRKGQKAWSETRAAGEALIDESFIHKLAKEKNIPFDDMVAAVRSLSDSATEEQIRAASEAARITQENAAVPGTHSDEAENKAVLQAVQSAEVARFFNALAQSKLSEAGRALSMAKSYARVLKAGPKGQLFYSLFGTNNPAHPLARPVDAAKIAEGITVEKAQAAVRSGQNGLDLGVAPKSRQAREKGRWKKKETLAGTDATSLLGLTGEETAATADRVRRVNKMLDRAGIRQEVRKVNQETVARAETALKNFISLAKCD